MLGILLIVSQEEDEITFSTELNKVHGLTKEHALERAKEHERINIRFDQDTMRQEKDEEGVAHYEAMMEKVKTMKWSEQPNDQGHYLLDSIWAGPVSEEGMEYRFVPIDVNR